MNSTSMKAHLLGKSLSIPFAGLAALSCGWNLNSAQAQEVVHSPAAGHLQVVCEGGSDTRVSVPFHPVPLWSGPINAAPASPEAGVVRLNLGLTGHLSGSALVNGLHYLHCKEASPIAGRYFPIVAQGAGTVDVEADGADWTGIGAGARVEIVPAWTLDRLFPPAQQSTLSTFHPSVGRLATGRGSELLFFNAEGRGANLAPSRRFFLNEDGWIEVAGFAPAGDVPIPPGQAFIIRHPEGSAPTVFTALQQVYEGPVQLKVKVSDGKRQDSVVAPPRPVAITLGQIDLDNGLFEESASSDPADRADELLVYDNTELALNKQPSAIYFRSGGQWLEDAPGYPVADAVVLEPSAGLLIRKAAGGTDLELYWSNAPTYDIDAP